MDELKDTSAKAARRAAAALAGSPSAIATDGGAAAAAAADDPSPEKSGDELAAEDMAAGMARADKAAAKALSGTKAGIDDTSDEEDENDVRRPRRSHAVAKDAAMAAAISAHSAGATALPRAHLAWRFQPSIQQDATAALLFALEQSPAVPEGDRETLLRYARIVFQIC